MDGWTEGGDDRGKISLMIPFPETERERGRAVAVGMVEKTQKKIRESKRFSAYCLYLLNSSGMGLSYDHFEYAMRSRFVRLYAHFITVLF